MHVAASGEQWTIEHGDQAATIVEAGGGLRTYRVRGIDVLAGYEATAPSSSGRGQVLLPWPNRIRDGRYVFDGVAQQLALTEPKLGNASHGLVRWANWRLLGRGASWLRVGCRVHAQPGWSGTIDASVRYELGDGGLVVTIEAHNVGDVRVPFGCGMHPYVAIGATPREAIELRVPARVVLRVDDDRKLPVATVPVEGTECDLRTQRAIGGVTLDNAFGELERDADGCWRVRVAGLADRAPVTVWGDAAFRWVQVFTDKAANDGVDGARGVAIEPLSCPPDAFNSGVDLVTLAPGDTWRGAWGMQVARDEDAPV